jgi:effector-binding domain-containing protein
MEYRIERIHTDDQPVLCIRTTCKVEELPQLIGSAYGKIMQVLAQQNQQASGAPYVAYFNMDMQALQVEMGFPVAQALPGQGDVIAGVIPGGLKLTTMYTGPYEKMVPAYDQLVEYAKANSLEPTGTSYEYYFTGPETPIEQHQTQIVFPIK